MFKIKCSKSKDQQTITIKKADNFDLSGGNVFTVKVYSDDLGTAIKTLVLSGTEETSFKAGSVSIAASTLLTTSDDFYTIIVDVDGTESYPAGIGITLEATYQVFSSQGYVNVYSPDYRFDNVLIVCKNLLDEMNTIESMDSALQKRVDFTTRQDLLKQILSYE